MNIGPEAIMQMQLFDWIRSRPDIEPYAFHIGNERKCTPQQGSILKRSGVKAGVWDNFIAIPRNNYHGLFVELKAGKNKLSDKQITFGDAVGMQMYKCVVAWSYEDARRAIEDYLAIEKPCDISPSVLYPI